MIIESQAKVYRGVLLSENEFWEIPDDIRDEWVFSSDNVSGDGEYIMGYVIQTVKEGTIERLAPDIKDDNVEIELRKVCILNNIDTKRIGIYLMSWIG